MKLDNLTKLYIEQLKDKEYATDQKLTTIAAADPGVNEQAQFAGEKEK